MAERFGAKLTRRGMILMASLAVVALAACGGNGGGGGDGGGGDGGGGGGGGGTTTNRTISGRVTNALTGLGIAGVTVASSGRTTTTTADGNYTLASLPDTGTLTLTFTAAGFTTQAIDVTNTSQATLNVSMQPSGGTIGDVTQPPPPPDFDSLTR